MNVGKDFALPDDIASVASVVLGIRNSGKTNTGVVIVEGLLELRQQVVIIDPLDVWWGLKSSADGKSGGYPVTVLGGFHGDLPLAEGDGQVIADFLAENQASVILSLRHLSKSAQRRFVTCFAEQFYLRKGQEGRNTSVLVVIDEASSFIPQFMGRDEARMVGAMDDLVLRGRVGGIGALLIDQRAARLNKDVLTQIELMVAHRHTSPQDRKALGLWIEAHDTGDHGKEFLGSLASLKQGEAWFWSPGWLDVFQRVQVRRRRTFDSSASPKPGQPAKAPKAAARVDLEALQKSLAATIEKARADDPAELRKRIAELEKALDAKPDVDPNAEKMALLNAVHERDVIWLGHIQRFMAAQPTAKIDDLVRQADALQQEIRGCRDAMVSLIDKPPVNQVELTGRKPVATSRNLPGHQVPSEKQALPSGPISRSATQDLPGAQNGHAAKPLPGPEWRVLSALYWLRGESPDRTKVALYSRYHDRSKGFTNAIGTLRTAGLVDGLQITSEGERIAAPAAGERPSGHKLRDWIADWLRPAELRMLDRLLGESGERVGVDRLAEQMSYHPRSKSFTNALGRLRSFGVAEGYDRDGGVKAADVFFE